MKLRSRRRRKGESLSELAEDVKRLSRLVYREIHSNLQDEQATVQFINALTDDDFCIRLMQARPTSLYHTPEYEQLKETLLVVAEGVQKLLLKKRSASLKDDRLDARDAAKCWNCGKVGHFRRGCRQSPRQTWWASRYPGKNHTNADSLFKGAATVSGVRMSPLSLQRAAGGGHYCKRTCGEGH